MYYQSHMSTGQAPPPQTVTSHYAHTQPPLLPPGSAQYPPPQYGSHYTYANGLTTAPAAAPGTVSNALPTGQPVLPLPGVSQSAMVPASYSPGFDTTGQIAPPGMKPRVTATLWEDEGSLCFQVEARGICVARREDNHMINGTKLLNVAGMTRGRRDGILKSEKVRQVVKIGPMHLKGVWIPFDRALDFANKEKITELLYPLFVHNIGSLLCHPTNHSRNTQVMAAAQRKQEGLRAGQPGPGLPSLPPHHHPLALPGPQSTLSSHPPLGGRPGSLERAHTFPTPPTSASSVLGSMGSSDSFQWNQQGQSTNSISIDTSLSNSARSLPNTPATTPPGSTLQSMQAYPPVSQPYDSSRQMYQAPPTSSHYQGSNPSGQERPLYNQSNYVKSEMAPPSNRPAGSGAEQADTKPASGILQAGAGEAGATTGTEEEADHEHDGEYTHDSGAYDTNRGSYNYNATQATLSTDHSHISPELSGSPHQTGSGRATPRTAASQTYYTQQGYSTQPRLGQSSSNVYNVIRNERGTANGTSGTDVYGSQGDMTGSLQNGYGTQQSVLNGGPTLKRGRDDDEDDSRPTSNGHGMPMDLKRRKTLMDGGGTTIPSPTFNHPGVTATTTLTSSQRRR